jgi:hypothetical protein
VSKRNFFCYNFSALNPPLTVLMFEKSALNFFLASKGTILGSFFFTSSLTVSTYVATFSSFLGWMGACYYFYECSDSDSSSSLEILVHLLLAIYNGKYLWLPFCFIR